LFTDPNFIFQQVLIEAGSGEISVFVITVFEQLEIDFSSNN